MAGKVPLTERERAEWLSGLRLVDDSLMRACLGGPREADGEAPSRATECLQLIVRAALGDEALEIVSREPQAELRGLAGRSVVLDFRVRDSGGRLLDVEIESASSGFGPRRARLYASMLDATALPEGAGADKLPDACVIVVAERDLVGAGRLRSTYRRTCDEDGGALDDGSAILFVNCQAADSSPLGRVAHDFLCADPRDMLVPELAALVAQTKGAREEGGMPKMTSDNAIEQMLIDRNYESGLEDGIERGREQGLEKGLERGLEIGRSATSAMAESLRALGVSQSDIDAALEAAREALTA